jgi:hypothetical protein
METLFVWKVDTHLWSYTTSQPRTTSSLSLPWESHSRYNSALRKELKAIKQSHYTPWRRLGGEEILLLVFDFGTRWGEWLESRPGRALPPGKGLPVPIVQEAGWAPEPVWTQRAGKKIVLPLPGIELRLPRGPVRSQTLYLLSYPPTDHELVPARNASLAAMQGSASGSNNRYYAMWKHSPLKERNERVCYNA